MKVRRIWMFLALILIGYSGGIVTGVIVDVDTVYQTTVKRLKQKNSPGGSIVVDVDVEQPKTKKEIRKEDREKEKAIRQYKRDQKKEVRTINRERRRGSEDTT